METYYCNIALAFLLGFYDGDGTLHPRGNGMRARIYSSNRLFLDEVKKYYEIDNSVLVNTEPGETRYIFGEPVISKGYYLLNLGVDVLQEC